MAIIPGYKTTYEILSEGEGARVIQPRDKVTVHATGIVKETGKKFWSTKDPGQEPFSYQAGVGQVITGEWLTLKYEGASTLKVEVFVV